MGLRGRESKHFVKRQQGGGLIMIWAGIIGFELVGAFRVEDGLKMNSKTYCDFLNQHFIELLQIVSHQALISHFYA